MALFKNLFFNYLLSISSLLIPLMIFPYLTRVLDEDALGTYLWVDSITQYFIVLASFGIPYYGVREIAKAKEDADKVASLTFDLILLHIVFTLIACICYGISAVVNEELNRHFYFVRLGLLTLLFSVFLIEWLFQGLSRFKYITVRTLTIKALSLLLIYAFVRNSDDVRVYAVVTMLSVFLNAAVNISFFYRSYPIAFSISFERLKVHLRPLLVFFSINVSISVYTLLDSVFLGFLDSPGHLSLYAMPLKLVKIYWTVLNSATLVFLPKITKLGEEGNLVKMSDLLSKSMNIVILGSLPFILICNVFPEWILTTFFGKGYGKSADVLRLLSLLPLIIGICNVFSVQFLVAIHKEKLVLYATVVGLLISVVFNFLLIPRFSILGCAITTCLSELAVMGMMYLSSARFLFLKPESRLFWSMALAFAGTLLCHYFLSSLELSTLFELPIILSIYGTIAMASAVFIFRSAFVIEIIKLVSSYVRRYINSTV